MKIILAYSGGLDTSVILIWLKQNYDAEIIAFCADIGQEEELDGLTEKALRTGAAKCIIEDLREEFARDFIYKGNIIIAGRKSPKSLYDPQIATMESGDSIYDQGDATGSSG